jgi:hypothetical protein
MGGMKNIHHRPIKKFSLSGSIYDDSAIWRLKEAYHQLLDFQMRTSGYVIRLDIAPDFTLQYNEDTETFIFELSVYGIYVGRRNSEWIFGVEENKIIPIQQNRSNEYYSKVV